MKKVLKMLTAFSIAVISMVIAFSFSGSAADDENWVCAWGTAPTKIGVEGYNNVVPYLGDFNIRTVITPTASGKKVRIKISNAYGRSPLVLTRATIAKSLGGSKIDTSTTKIITFNEGYQGINLAPGEEIYSDPVVFPVTATEDKIAISIFAENFTEINTMGLSGAETYIAFSGDKTDDESFGLASIIDDDAILEVISRLLGGNLDMSMSYSFIKVVPCIVSLDVLQESERGYSVVVIGDSTVANEFPLYLAESIKKLGITDVGVVGKGIFGNRLLGDGLGLGSQIFGKSMIDRFDADALSQSGVKYVIVKIGVNDIVHPVCNDIVGVPQPTANEIIEGYRTIFKKCHDAGIKVIAVSITQWRGNTRNYFGSGDKYVRTEAEFLKDWKIATDVNKWLSTTDEHDGYVDFAELSSNPKDFSAMLPEYTIDGVHPSDTLQRIWGEKFPLSLIGVGKRVNKITLNSEAFSVYTGESKQLKATVYPADADDKTVKWSSSNKNIATVSSAGKVTGVSNGTATITCKSSDGVVYATCKVTVVTAAESVSLNKTKAEVYTTKSFNLSAVVLPETATNKKVTWSSSDTKVATVDTNGKVTGVGSGTATITCTTVNKGLTATCVVTVLKKTEVISIQLNKTSGSMYKGQSYTFTMTMNPSDATYKQVKWTSSDTKVISVDANGKIKAVGAGTATVTCTSVDNPMIKGSCTVKVNVKTTGVKLNKTSGYLYEGQSGKLTATVSPADATNKKLTWTSSNTSIATVDSSGKITAKKPGTVYITCTTNNGGYTAQCKLTVRAVIKTTSVKLNKTSGSMNAGTTYTFTVTVAPSNATNKGVTFKSSNPAVLEVNKTSGKIRAIKPGTATVTCTTNDTGKTAKCVVTVKAVVPTKVTLNKTSGSMNYNQTYQLKATVYPSNATDKSLTWKSSDPSVVYVNSKGVIQALKPGKSAVITCTTVSGKKVAQCTVKVNPIKVTGVKLNKSSGSMKLSQTYTLKATVSPSNATNKAVTWTSSNPKVVTVNSSGTIKAVGTGTATITCKTKDGGYKTACIIQVKSVKVLGVTLNKTSVTMNKGATYTLTPTVVPTNATNKSVTWKSSNTSVATVSGGKVTAVGKGTCEVKVYTVDGNYIAVCKIIVQ